MYTVYSIQCIIADQWSYLLHHKLRRCMVSVLRMPRYATLCHTMSRCAIAYHRILRHGSSSNAVIFNLLARTYHKI